MGGRGWGSKRLKAEGGRGGVPAADAIFLLSGRFWKCVGDRDLRLSRAQEAFVDSSFLFSSIFHCEPIPFFRFCIIRAS